ncbi:partial Alpha-maltose-1-phosphate synthase, partial [Anaerolineae bacterium]
AGWRANAAALMNAFDAVLMPSLWEGFGLVVLEAMAARLPVIASNVSALPEIVVQDETGLLVAAGDTAGLEKAMRYMVGDSEGARRMGAAGRTRLESQFSVARMVEQTVQVYQRRGASDPHS